MKIVAITTVQYPFPDDRNSTQVEYLPVDSMEEAINFILEEYDNCDLHEVESTIDYTLLTGYLITGWRPTIVVLLHKEI